MTTQWLEQPGIEQSDQSQISTEKPRNYYVGLKEWITNASCNFLYIRHPLSGAFSHPSCMVFPPGELEPEPVAPIIKERGEYVRPEYEIEDFENPSK